MVQQPRPGAALRPGEPELPVLAAVGRVAARRGGARLASSHTISKPIGRRAPRRAERRGDIEGSGSRGGSEPTADLMHKFGLGKMVNPPKSDAEWVKLDLLEKAKACMWPGGMS
jgi:hypothetical protein